MSSTLKRRLAALGLGAFAFALVLAAQRDQGIARDEVVYMRAGDRYASWWIDLVTGKEGTMRAATITSHFGGGQPTANNREHPPLMKTLFGLSRRLFHDKLGWASELTAYRLPNAAAHGLLVALVFLFVSLVWGWAEAVLAALFALLLPRALFHAGLAAFDAPIVTFWFATIYAYYLALRSRAWCLGLGVAFGLALATKHNAVMLPAVMFSHYLYAGYRQGRAGAPGAAFWRALGTGCLRLRPLVVLAVLVLGPLVLVLLWPWLWFEPFAHASDWIGFHLSHVHYNFEYLGRNWNAPPFPWHVVFVTTLFTVPVVTLLAGALGAGVLLHRARRGEAAAPESAPALLLFLSAGASMGAIMLPSTPIFGAEKHWAPAMPTICVFAAVGLLWAARLAADRLGALGWIPRRARGVARPLCAALLGAAALAAAAVETADAHPYALSHYNALAGGAPGGADLGMNRQFWGYAARGVLPFLSERAPGPGEAPRRVYSHDASPAWPLYRRYGMLAPGLPDAGRERAGIRRSQYALVIHEKHFNRHDYLIWDDYGTVQPVYVLTTDGVPIVTVYARDPELAGAAGAKIFGSASRKRTTSASSSKPRSRSAR